MNSTSGQQSEQGQREWLSAIQQQLTWIMGQDEKGTVASFHSLQTVLNSLTDAAYGNSEYVLRIKTEGALAAVRSRMHMLINDAGTRKERRRLRSIFFNATEDWGFWRPWPW